MEFTPYPGLRPFLREETDIFFGRERHIDQMVDRLRLNRFLSVTGASGSGKSSLVKTGLLSALDLGLLDEAGGAWRVVEMRPGNHPLEVLAGGLLEALDLPAEPNDVGLTRAALERGPLSLAEFLKSTRPGLDDSILILVDQFEEIFRFADEDNWNEAAAFVDLLLGSARQRDVPVFIVVTMRSDYLGECSRFDGLAETINTGQFLTPRMTRDELREAIEEPARVAGGAVSDEASNRLLNDMVGVPDQLCLMQHAMMMMWRRAHGRDPQSPEITLEDYEEIGGLAGALSQHADEIFDGLASDRHREIAEVLFRRLTEGSGRDNRRPPSPPRSASS